ncbi:predicted protein [Lichtheimia corymbifera JMRC:FSU:9682]|uniref:Uncharacterized protein n=1 Tax=Lichtheimia corymbifera JMRC:FSU:9682 TaxID=1263082 RepID=A0A068RNS7_9FUNG|nr:predicted protein [Lichtheimia corymbifera JMRC:FSU:9682]
MNAVSFDCGIGVCKTVCAVKKGVVLKWGAHAMSLPFSSRQSDQDIRSIDMVGWKQGNRSQVVVVLEWGQQLRMGGGRGKKTRVEEVEIK